MKHCGNCGQPTQYGHDDHGTAHHYCTACGWRWYSPPTPIVLVLVTNDAGEVVYARKASFEPGRWSVISGFVPQGERAEVTAVREVKEETGLDVELVAFLGTHVYDRIPDQIVLAYRCRVVGGTLQAQDDIDQAEFGPPDPSRVRHGSTSWLLVRSLIEEVPEVLHFPLQSGTPVRS
ncbi:MAG TPA: NUDIX domain-containing protein [Dehalococcoidia bacterium]|jgi:NAD+ diphosphatase|nr:NUDIX domain-containing protein [Dehalococcoidia bacterium]